MDSTKDKVEFPATKIAHWPGQSIACCEEHAKQIEGVGKALGYPVAFSDAQGNLVCVNCMNEKGGE